MNIININVDSSVFDKNSSHFKRLVDYSYLVDSLTVIVPYSKKEVINVSGRLFIFGTGGKSKFFRFFNLYVLVKKIVSNGKFDIITVQDQYYLALIGWFLARKFKAGLELQIHGFEKYSGLRKIIANFVIPRANAVRCVSERLKKQLIEEFGVKEEKITAAPIFTNLKNKISNLKSDRTRNDKFVFLTVGRLVPVKNIGLQIMAMGEVVKKYPNAELWIVGDGIEKSNLKSKISRLQRLSAAMAGAAKLKLENNIKFLGWQNNPEEFYSQADAFLLTSDYEGWGMVVVEAAKYSLPIIMTDVGCAGELIKNDESGIVIPVNNQAKLEEAMIRVINDNNLRKKLAEGALSAIKNLPSKEETLALYKQSWEKAVSNK